MSSKPVVTSEVTLVLIPELWWLKVSTCIKVLQASSKVLSQLFLEVPGFPSAQGQVSCAFPRTAHQPLGKDRLWRPGPVVLPQLPVAVHADTSP
jgi:hypothetical protein